MYKIYLHNKKLSEIDFNIYKFPDGQQNIVLKNIPEDAKHIGVSIISRFNNFKDLELIICTVKALRNLKIGEIVLVVPYILGGRSDRQFEYGSTSYIKDVIAPILNSLKLDCVMVLNPHSEVIYGSIKNLMKLNDKSVFYAPAFGHLYNTIEPNPLTLCAPDLGAAKKVQELAQDSSYGQDILQAFKKRNFKGEVEKVDFYNYHSTLDYEPIAIIDDICDGGATFIHLAKRLKQLGHKGSLYLFVTHGIFSKGYDELREYYDAIYTTNSIKNQTKKEKGFVTRIKII